MLDELTYHVDSLNNREWVDRNGDEVGKGSGLVTLERTPGVYGELGTVLFQKKHDKALNNALLSPIEPRLGGVARLVENRKAGVSSWL